MKKKMKWMQYPLMALLLFASVGFANMLTTNTAKAESKLYNVNITGTLARSELPEFIELVNEARAEVGLAPVRLSQAACEVAEERAAQSTLVLYHCLPTGQSIDRNIISGEIQCENSLGNAYTPTIDTIAKAAFDCYKTSESHFNWLLRENTTQIGVAFYYQKETLNQANPSFTCICCTLLDPAESPYESGYADVERTFDIAVSNGGLLTDWRYISGDGTPEQRYSLEIGESQKISPRYTSSYVTCDPILGVSWFMNDGNGAYGQWVSDDPDILSVTSDGRVTAVGVGSGSVSFLVNGDENKKYTCYFTTTAAAVPLTPITDITCTQIGSDTVRVSWAAADYATGYHVYYGTEPGVTPSTAAGETGKGRRYKDLTFSNAANKTFYFTVTGIDENGDESEMSDVASFTFSTDEDEFLNVGKGSSPVVKKKTYNKVSVSWTKVHDATHYLVERNDRSSNKWETIYDGTGTGCNVAARVGNEWRYHVRPYAISNGKRVYGETGDNVYYTNYLSKTKTYVKWVGKRSAKVSWKAVAGATTYKVTVSGKGYKKTYTVKGTSKTIKNLKKNRSYKVYVKAYRKEAGYWESSKASKAKWFRTKK